MEWNAENYQKTCGRVTEHGTKLVEIETELKHIQWDGSNWHLPNRRIRFIARKI